MACTELTPTQLADKDPSDVKDYHNAWASKLNDASKKDDGLLQGDTIDTNPSDSTWVITGDDALLIKDSDLVQVLAITIDGVLYPAYTVSTIWLSGGTDGVTYTLANKIITAGGRTYEKTFTICVRHL